MPLTTEAEADDFIVAMYALGWGLETNHAKLVVPVFEHKKVAAYLTRAENQRKDGWPEVLGIWCRTYADLLTANTMLGCLADPVTLDRLLAETRDGNEASPLEEGPRRKCHDALIQLKALMEGLRDSWGPDNAQVLTMVRALRPVAKERGTYTRVDKWTGRLVLYVARGDGTTGALNWDYKKNTAWLRSVSVHVPRSQRDSFAPRYELLALSEGGDSVERHSLDATSGSLSDGTTVVRVRDGRGETFTDLSAMAFNEGTIGIDVGGSPQTLVSLSVEEYGPAQYLNYYTVDKDGKGVRVDTEPRLAGATTVRSLYLPAAPLPDDPDAGALKDAGADPPGPALTAQNSPVALRRRAGPQRPARRRLELLGRGGRAAALDLLQRGRRRPLLRLGLRQGRDRLRDPCVDDQVPAAEVTHTRVDLPRLPRTVQGARGPRAEPVRRRDARRGHAGRHLHRRLRRSTSQEQGRHQLVGGARGRGGAGGQAARAVLAGAREPARQPGGGAVARAHGPAATAPRSRTRRGVRSGLPAHRRAWDRTPRSSGSVRLGQSGGRVGQGVMIALLSLR